MCRAQRHRHLNHRSSPVGGPSRSRSHCPVQTPNRQRSGKVSAMTKTQVGLLKEAISRDLPHPMTQWPGGYPGEVEAALIDAVLSIRATYGSSVNTGVRGAVGRYRDAVGGGELNDLARLAGFSEQQLVTILQNRQKTSGVLKADAILQAAANLTTAGVVRADELSPEVHRRAYTQVRGLGGVTWEYFTMLLGHPGIKADRWITRWVSNAVVADRQLTSEQAHDLLMRAATELSEADAEPSPSLTQLDHAIWRVARGAGTST